MADRLDQAKTEAEKEAIFKDYEADCKKITKKLDDSRVWQEDKLRKRLEDKRNKAQKILHQKQKEEMALAQKMEEEEEDAMKRIQDEFEVQNTTPEIQGRITLSPQVDVDGDGGDIQMQNRKLRAMLAVRDKQLQAAQVAQEKFLEVRCG